MERRRVVVLSDLHLGHAATQVDEVKYLEPLLEGADEVIFNGDTCEQMYSAWREKGRMQLEELKNLCGKLEAEARFLSGNHDPDVEGAGWLDLRGGQIFVTHGDMILPDIAPWSLECIERRERVREVLGKFKDDVSTLEVLHRRAQLVEEELKPSEEPRLGSKGRNYLMTAIWPPLRPVNILRAWLTMFAEAERFTERYRPSSEVFLFGHFHRPAVRRRGKRIYCNTGAFMRGTKALMVELEGDWMTVRAIVRDEDGYFRPGDPRGSFRLGDQRSGKQ